MTCSRGYDDRLRTRRRIKDIVHILHLGIIVRESANELRRQSAGIAAPYNARDVIGAGDEIPDDRHDTEAICSAAGMVAALCARSTAVMPEIRSRVKIDDGRRRRRQIQS